MNEPTRPVGTAFMVLLALANLGLWMALFAPIQVLLAQQMEAVAPAAKEAALGYVTAAGALVAMIANPLFGAASDRTRTRLGRRHPWTLGGALVGAGALVMLGRQATLTGIALWWCLAQAALNAMLSALTAEVPDQVPVSQRARCSAWAGVSQPLGVVLGTVVVTAVATTGDGHGIETGYALVAMLLVAAGLPFVWRVPAVPGASSAPWREALLGLWISPRRAPDFAWAWFTRFLLNLGNALATLYLLYFLRDAVHYELLFPGERAEDGLLLLIGLYTAGVLAAAFASGTWSDRTGRRKSHVLLSGVVMAAANALLALWPTWPVAMAAAVLMGLGFGIYLAVDQALVTQVLPAACDRGKDLGVINIANSAPQVLAPAVAAVLVTQAGGYPALYAASAVVTLLGGMLVRKIRAVE
ncbi:MFS transporter [Ideonella sp. YS5]|uniref:MFS transporter n=1 Tax=Ideonella sp. YS5 TaxID=3453714 RepID=UPI003EEC4054